MDKSFVFDKMWFNQFLLGWSSVKTTLVLGVIVLLCILLFKGENRILPVICYILCLLQERILWYLKLK